jgi:hypothetical protein
MIMYLLDENLDPSLRRALKRAQPEMIVWRVGDVSAPPLRSPDPDILVWCEENEHVLVTNNRASMPVHLVNHLSHDRHLPGILVIKKNMPWGVLLDELEFIWQHIRPDELIDQIKYLPLARPDSTEE